MRRPDPPPRSLPRFGRTARWVHRSVAGLMTVCLATALVLYVAPLSVLVGHRSTVELVHVVAGLALPVPVLAGWWSGALRADLRRLNRFSRTDWAWLRSRDRRGGGLPVGKFNAGQKLNAALVAGAVLVLLGSGVVMRFANAWPVRLRTGATFVHDWVAYAVAALVIGHLRFAARDREARRGMRTGWVDELWARREHRGWAEEVAGGPAGADAGARTAGADAAAPVASRPAQTAPPATRPTKTT